MKRISEAAGAVAQLTGRTQLVTIITPGWGSSAYYSKEALQQAVKDRVWPAGTQMHVDHPTPGDEADRPERSLQTLAATLQEDAFWNDTEQAVQARAQVFPRWREDLNEMRESIGVSIYTMAEAEPGQAEGRSGNLVTRLLPDPFNTIDYVTKPGRGGKIVALLEALKESTHNELQDKLRDAVRAAYGGDGQYVWLLDSDDTSVWFEAESPDGTRTYQQSYTQDDDNVTLADGPVEVERRVTWVPVSTSEDSSPTPAGDTTESGTTQKESDMPNIEIDEQELTALRESASRADQLQKDLESERSERAREAAEARVASAEAAVRGEFGEDAPAFFLESARRAAASEDYDHDAFVAQVKEAAAREASDAGAGEPSGVGTPAPATVTESGAPQRTDLDIIKALG